MGGSLRVLLVVNGPYCLDVFPRHRLLLKPGSFEGLRQRSGLVIGTFPSESLRSFTFDLYGHLMPGAESETARLLDAFLHRADSQARATALGK